MKFGKGLLFACASICFFPAAELRASTTSPLPVATTFAYSISHTVKPLPDAVFEKIATPEVDSIDAVDGVVPDVHEPAVDARVGAPRALSRNGLCSAVASVAKANNLPIPFFANLIWQESNFNTKTISRAGALGIAQFMPRTANEFGLINPFEPIHALNVAGKFVRDLYRQFGNLGLAAAAYNAGPGRVTSWMAKRGDLPAETRAYVLKITGRSADEWASPDIKKNPEAMLQPAKAPCVEVAEAVQAQTKTVRLAKLMMEIATAAVETRDRPEMAPPDDTGGPVAEANWRTRALRMVKVMLERMDRKQRQASAVAARSDRMVMKVAVRNPARDDDRLPGRNARMPELQPVDAKLARIKWRDKGRTAARPIDKAELKLDAAAAKIEVKIDPKVVARLENKVEAKAGPKNEPSEPTNVAVPDAETAKPAAPKPAPRHRRVRQPTIYAYSNNYGRPY